MSTSQIRPVLILGAGINGAAVARELVLNDVPVCIVELNDIAFGTTAKSSRLIHGGLRYLEYGDIGLVRESLEERNRLLRLAPQFVRPLRLYVPVGTRLGGLYSAILKFCGLSRFRWGHLLASKLGGSTGRGFWLVRLGLWFYDFLATDRSLPKHSVMCVGAGGTPKVNNRLYRWLCAYWDTQMIYPERFVIALLDDVRQIALERGSRVDIYTYHYATREGKQVRIKAGHPGDHANGIETVVKQIEPCVIVNATGAWGDLTLSQFEIPSRRLFGGTKGSHIFTRQERLCKEIGADGIYAETLDGRMVFILPCFGGVLIGTTDIRFDESPGKAAASQQEIDYLIHMVNQVLPEVKLNGGHVEWHYGGVRPLPYLKREATASIPRGHWIDFNRKGEVPVLTLIGGKLTTCRSLAEQVTDFVLKELGAQRIGGTRERAIPGGDSYPNTEEEMTQACQQLAERLGFAENQVRAIWSLCGTRVVRILDEIGDAPKENLVGTDFPLAYIKWVIDNEWVTTLGDLVERRLMLVYGSELSTACLNELARCLVDAGALQPESAREEVNRTLERLRRDYGRELTDSN